jgi:hypothetical protein
VTFLLNNVSLLLRGNFVKCSFFLGLILILCKNDRISPCTEKYGNIEDVNTNLRVFLSGSDSNKENLLPPATPKRPAEDGEILLI